MNNNKRKIFKPLSTKKKLLFVATAAFLFSFSCSVTATAAWYSINDMFAVNHLNINFTTMDISLRLGIRDNNGDIVFKDEYDEEELGFGDEELDEVSGMYAEDWLNEDISSDIKVPKFRQPYRFSSNHRKTDYAEGGYVQKEFFLLSSQDCSLYLSDESYFAPNLDLNHEVAVNEGLNEDELNNVVNATRISFYSEDKYVIANPGIMEETYYGGLLDLHADGYYDYEDDKEIIYGQVEGDVKYKDEVLPSSLPYEDSNSVFVANHKDNIQLADVENTNIKKEDAVAFDKVTINLDEGNTTNEPLCILHKDEVKRVVVSIYLEGWDLDMIDSIQKSSFDVLIVFAGLYNI